MRTRTRRPGQGRLSVSSMWSSSPTMPAEPPMGLTGRVTPPQSAHRWEEQPMAPALPHLESAVSSPSLVAAAAVPTIPTL